MSLLAIVAIGLVFVVILTPLSFWIADRTNDFVAFLVTLVSTCVIYPLVILFILQ